MSLENPAILSKAVIVEADPGDHRSPTVLVGTHVSNGVITMEETTHSKKLNAHKKEADTSRAKTKGTSMVSVGHSGTAGQTAAERQMSGTEHYQSMYSDRHSIHVRDRDASQKPVAQMPAGFERTMTVSELDLPKDDPLSRKGTTAGPTGLAKRMVELDAMLGVFPHLLPLRA